MLAYFPLFHQLDTLPLRLWDEARRGVNALEMAAGESLLLVPTFDGEPDRWGTKPPLLVWSQALAIKLLGPGELAVRLPAALAGLATAFLLFFFARRQLGDGRIGILAALILLTSDLYIESHGARAGDFDAVLVLWLTGGVLSFYSYLQERNSTYLYQAAVFLLLAGWTKGVAAFFFLPAMALYALIHSDHRWIWREGRLYLSIGLAGLGVVSYYFLRELNDPGFLRAVWENELGGRYLASQEGHQWGPFFYLRMLWKYELFSPWLAWLPFALLMGVSNLKLRSLQLYLMGLSVWLLFVLAGSATKLTWYMLPIFPLLALAIGAGFWEGFKLLQQRLAQPNWLPTALGLALCLAIFGAPYYHILQKVNQRQHGPDYQQVTVYRDFFKNLPTHTQATVLLPSFNPHAVFYQKISSLEEMQLDIDYLQLPASQVDATPDPVQRYQAGQEVIVCEMAPWLHMDENYQFTEVMVAPPCKLLKVINSKE